MDDSRARIVFPVHGEKDLVAGIVHMVIRIDVPLGVVVNGKYLMKGKSRLR
jgi:hypothetical protein